MSGFLSGFLFAMRVQRVARSAIPIAALMLCPILPLLAQPRGPNADPPPTKNGYAGWELCQGCHLDLVNAWKETKMGKILLASPRNELEARACEACHGPAKAHIKANDNTNIIRFTKGAPTSAAIKNAQCLQCHDKGSQRYWSASVHEARNVACTDCHTMMHNTAERANLAKETVLETCGRCHPQRVAQQQRFSHMPMGQGKMECTSCHNPHGSANDKLLVANSVNETCYSCHAEKRGPFLWEHVPVMENCANCHDPHGSNHEKLLKVPRPRLCQQCHNTGGHPTVARNPATPADMQFVFNRQCSNCHFNIHGSNHPSGAFFTR